MSKVERFEDLKVWQFSKDFNLVGQIKSTSGSVMDNIA